MSGARAGVRGLVVALLAGAVLLSAADAWAILRGSELAVPLVTGRERPELVFAERAITRSWGPSDDSTYVVTDVPEWRSEGLAAVLSAAVPGAGQAYVGEGSGLWFALAEVAGWTARTIFRHKSDTEEAHAAAFAGDPTDSTSAWSFQRWAAATGGDPTDLRLVWEKDPETFYELIANSDVYMQGWENSYDTRIVFVSTRDLAHTFADRASWSEYGLWLNHVLAAFDALRAARLQNFPLRQNLGLKIKTAWRGGRPNVMAVLERRF